MLQYFYSFNLIIPPLLRGLHACCNKWIVRQFLFNVIDFVLQSTGSDNNNALLSWQGIAVVHGLAAHT